MQNPTEALNLLPAGAIWNAELEGWEVCERDASGTRHGESKLYREDGTLALTSTYVAGMQQGPFTRYHRNGRIAGSGRFVDGAFEGEILRYGDGEGTPIQPCCVPPGAVELRAFYTRGNCRREVFYDAERRPLCSDGTRWPERPSAIPDAAQFDEESRHWLLETDANEAGARTLREFDATGRLLTETTAVGGRPTRSRSFDELQRLQEEAHFDAGGAWHGAYRRRYAGTESPSPYANASVVEELRHFHRGSSVGVWELFDAAGRTLARYDLGAPLDSEGTARLHDDLVGESAADLQRRAEQLLGAQRLREALCLYARSAARSGDPSRLVAACKGSVPALREEVATERAAALSRADAGVGQALDALVSGADLCATLRVLSSLFPAASAVAGELVNAAILVDPSRPDGYLTRALMRLEHADVDGLQRDLSLARKDARSTAGADFVETLARVTFCEFRFAPTRALLVSDPNLPALEVEQSLDGVRRAIGVYATRLGLVRNELLKRLGQREYPTWLPPDTSTLLPEGPLELRCDSVSITDETEEGIETSEVAIDERLELTAETLSRLMYRARADWAALCWLCWAVGLDGVALPDTLQRRPALATAINLVSSRTFYLSDLSKTGGIVARTRGVPAYEWEGLSSESLTSHLLDIALLETFEVRAALFFLLFAENVSPFQSDLRRP